jgi:hypothetical protein
MPEFFETSIPKWRLETILRAMSGVIAERVPQKFWHAIIRTKPDVVKHLEDWFRWRQDLLLGFVKRDENGKPIPLPGGGPGNNWESSEAEAEFVRLVNVEAVKEVPVRVFRLGFATTFPDSNSVSAIGSYVAELDFMFPDIYEVGERQRLAHEEDEAVVRAPRKKGGVRSAYRRKKRDIE